MEKEKIILRFAREGPADTREMAALWRMVPGQRNEQNRNRGICQKRYFVQTTIFILVLSARRDAALK
jgi:hypothetical protein